MLTRLLGACAVTIAIVVTAAGQARAWGIDAHKIIARVASGLLPPQKAFAIDELLRQSVINGGIIEASLYADWVIRPQDTDHVFAPWHFINWTISEPYADAFCQPTCILVQLPKQIEAMKTETDRDKKALAVSWVIHLVSDMHQPMHMGDNRDEGGTDFRVTYRGANRCAPPHNVRVSLHMVWDYCLVSELTTSKSWWEVADELRGGLTTYKGHPAATGTSDEWGKQAHEAARDVAYVGVQQGDDIQDPYINRTLPTAREQLMRAAVRLAMVLDELDVTWPPASPAPETAR